MSADTPLGLASPGPFGPYQVLSLLGKGGMGEVFRARDTRLGREVAIKTLPPEFARDPDRLSRFQREARALAALNHANIASIYELEESASGSYLVMELVDGETLADRLARGGAMAFADAIRVAVQVASALDAAHQKGIVHRDLKPANIGLTREGTVKVLDFGLVKVRGDPAGDPEGLATRSGSLTQAGAIVGTLPYMSPEQLQGKPLDQRTDIWAFGAILYELFTGRRLFGGESGAETVAAVLTRPIDLDAVPARVRALLGRCLERDPGRRLRHIGDIGLQLEVDSAPAPARRRSRATWLWPAVAATATLIAVAVGWLALLAPAPPGVPTTRLEVVEPAGVAFSDQFSVSPDGQRLAFIARVNDRRELWVRSLESFDAHPLVGEAIDGSSPIWSPDGRAIVYWHRGNLYRVDAAGGTPRQVATAPQAGPGFWSADDRLVYSTRAEGLLRVSVRNGEAATLTTLAPGELLHRSPSPLPGGTHFLYARLTGADQGNIHVGSLDAPAEQQDMRPVVSDATAAAFVSRGDQGYVLFLRGSGRLYAQRFDPSRRLPSGDPLLLAEHVADREVGALGGGVFRVAAFSVSPDGVLAYRTELKAADTLTVFDRKGSIVDRLAEPGLHGQIALSPDETRLAAVRRDTEQRDIYIYEMSGARRRTRFTFNPLANGTPVWSPDGRRIAFSSEREAGRLDLHVKGALGAGGAEELLYRATDRPGVQPTDWSPDGRYILLWSTVGSEKPQNDVIVVSVADRTARTLIAGAGFPSFSPDGRWVAYWTSKSGQGDIYVRPFDPAGTIADPPEWTVSNGARPIRPLWRGHEIFYRDREQNIVSVRVKVGGGSTPTLSAGVPEILFPLGAPVQSWAVSRNAERFILPMPVSEAQAAAYKIVLNWDALVER